MAAMYLRGIDLEDDLALRGRQLDLLLGLKVGCPQQSMRANGKRHEDALATRSLGTWSRPRTIFKRCPRRCSNALDRGLCCRGRVREGRAGG